MFFVPVIVEAIFFLTPATSAAASAAARRCFSPIQGDARVDHAMCGAPHARFAKIRAVEAALGVETLIEKIRGKKYATPAMAFPSVHGSLSPIPV